MILIKPDKNRRIDIEGVAAPVLRPVDIDQAITGYTNLRTLRIYSFEADSVIEGHAEEDEVFIVLLSGSIELTMFEDLSTDSAYPVTLSAPAEEYSRACAAYLPPHAAYKLIAQSDADVAYARATPSGTSKPKLFFPSGYAALLLEATDYAERLRIRLVQIDALQENSEFMPVHESEALCEALVHIRTVPCTGGATITPSGAAPILLDSWDTVAIKPGDRATFQIAVGSSAVALIVLAIG